LEITITIQKQWSESKPTNFLFLLVSFPEMWKRLTLELRTEVKGRDGWEKEGFWKIGLLPS